MSDDEPPPKAEDDGAEERFLASFADLMSLLVVFFVLLYSMSEIKREVFQALIETFTATFNPERPLIRQENSADERVEFVPYEVGEDLQYLFGVIGDHVKNDPQLDGVRINLLDDRIVLSLPGEGMFANKDGVSLTRKAREIFSNLGNFLKNIDNRLDIEVHNSDDVRIRGDFGNLWEYTTARARNISAYLESREYADNTAAYGMSSSRYIDLTLDLPEQRRLELQNRVDLIIRETTRGGMLGLRDIE